MICTVSSTYDTIQLQMRPVVRWHQMNTRLRRLERAKTLFPTEPDAPPDTLRYSWVNCTIQPVFPYNFEKDLQKSSKESLVMGQPSFQASNAIIYLTYGAFL